MAKWRIRVENELKTDGENYWVNKTLIRAMSYADALRCADLLDDGESYETAETESETTIITEL